MAKESSEELRFRRWAKNNYRSGTPIYWWWDSVIKDECRKINKKATSEKAD